MNTQKGITPIDAHLAVDGEPLRRPLPADLAALAGCVPEGTYTVAGLGRVHVVHSRQADGTTIISWSWPTSDMDAALWHAGRASNWPDLIRSTAAAAEQQE